MDKADLTRGRREALISGVSACLTVLTGCSTHLANRQNLTEEATTTTTASEGDTTTATAEPATKAADSPTLPSLNVAGSPGGLVTLEPDGKAVLLDFFATWCPPCKPEMENLRAVSKQYDREQVSIVSITQETDEAAIEAFWKDNQGTWPVVMDPSARAARQYGVTMIPTILVFTPGGVEVARHTGLVGEQPLVDAIDAALARESVP